MNKTSALASVDLLTVGHQRRFWISHVCPAVDNIQMNASENVYSLW